MERRFKETVIRFTGRPRLPCTGKVDGCADRTIGCISAGRSPAELRRIPIPPRAEIRYSPVLRPVTQSSTALRIKRLPGSFGLRQEVPVLLKAGYALEREGGERLRFSNAEFIVRASAESTAGAFTIIEETDPLETAAHIHAYEDELFYVLEGEHIFACGEDEFRVGPGGTVFAPRGIAHAHRRLEPRTGRFLTLTRPAGFERFFRDLAAAEHNGQDMAEAYAKVSAKFGVTWLSEARVES